MEMDFTEERNRVTAMMHCLVLDYLFHRLSLAELKVVLDLFHEWTLLHASLSHTTNHSKHHEYEGRDVLLDLQEQLAQLQLLSILVKGRPLSEDTFTNQSQTGPSILEIVSKFPFKELKELIQSSTDLDYDEKTSHVQMLDILRIVVAWLILLTEIQFLKQEILSNKKWRASFLSTDAIEPLINAMNDITSPSNLNHILHLQSFIVSFIETQPSVTESVKWLQSPCQLDKTEWPLSLSVAQAECVLYDIATTFREIYRQAMVDHVSKENKNIRKNCQRVSVIDI
jgi:hypothetical protein